MKYLILICLLFTTTGLTRADGVIELNQACVDIGCFAGDSAGFPIQIGESGNYRLTSNLETGAVLIRAIQISGDGVTLDLNGHTISGAQSCRYDDSLNEVHCDLQRDSVGSLISAIGSNHTIKNGTVKGALGEGISLTDVRGGPHLVENIHFSENGMRSTRAEGDGPITSGTGIEISPNIAALIRNCTSSLTHSGFMGSEHTRFQGNLSFETQGNGFEDGVCSDNTVFKFGPGAAYQDCLDMGGNSP